MGGLLTIIEVLLLALTYQASCQQIKLWNISNQTHEVHLVSPTIFKHPVITDVLIQVSDEHQKFVTLYLTIKLRFDELSSSGKIDTSEIFLLAIRIKTAMETKGIPTEIYENFNKLKNQLPDAARMLIFSEKVYIINKGFKGQYLYATTNRMDDKRRYVLLWVPGDLSDAGRWNFSTNDDGKSFFIENCQNNEYMYAAADSYAYDSDRRNIYTYYQGHPSSWAEKSGHFVIELLSGNEITIKSKPYGEYLYAANYLYKGDEQRRHAFTWRKKNDVIDDVYTWIIQQA